MTVFGSLPLPWMERHGFAPQSGGEDGRRCLWPWDADHEMILLMDKILHHQGWWLSHYLQGFIHPRWCRISSINSWSSTAGNLNFFSNWNFGDSYCLNPSFFEVQPPLKLWGCISYGSFFFVGLLGFMMLPISTTFWGQFSRRISRILIILDEVDEIDPNETTLATERVYIVCIYTVYIYIQARLMI